MMRRRLTSIITEDGVDQHQLDANNMEVQDVENCTKVGSKADDSQNNNPHRYEYNQRKSCFNRLIYRWKTSALVAAVLLVLSLLFLIPRLHTKVINLQKQKQNHSIHFAQKDIEKSRFLLPEALHPGSLHHLKWRRDHSVIDPSGRLIGLPPELTQEIAKFTKESGLWDIFPELLYGEESTRLPPGESRILNLNDGRKWTATTPASDGNWIHSDLHWVDSADEENFEETLRVLKRGKFDIVLDAIGKEFGAQGLMVAGMGFILTSFTEKGDVHRDLPDSGNYWWDLLFPLTLPDQRANNNFAGLTLADTDEKKNAVGHVRFTPNVGIIVGGDTRHATTECDYRKTKEFRVAVTVYVVDVNEQNAGIVASDGTALFPVPNQVDWLLAQKGRLWGERNSLENDSGRKPFAVHDEVNECPKMVEEGLCEKDLWGMRFSCLKSCGVYIDDERYFSEFFPPSVKD